MDGLIFNAIIIESALGCSKHMSLDLLFLNNIKHCHFVVKLTFLIAALILISVSVIQFIPFSLKSWATRFT